LTIVAQPEVVQTIAATRSARFMEDMVREA
jgi:hypothetical protein